MSLLINALKKAEGDKKAADVQSSTADSLSLELTPRASESSQTAESLSLAANAEPAKALPSNTAEKLDDQKAAGNLFQVKNPPAKKSPVLLYGGLTVGILLIALGGFYYYLETLTPSNIVIPHAPVNVASNQASEPPATSSQPVIQAPIAPDAAEPEVNEDAELAVTEQAPSLTTEQSTAVFAQAEKLNVVESPPTISRNTTPSNRQSAKLAFGDAPQGLPENNKLNITRKAAENTINPNLLAAYNAYSAGDDAQAQQLYRKVLQADSRNIDALLGMAAIAARQGRLNDANGWYTKVLEVEPRNSFALTAMSDLSSQSDPVSAESKLKSLLAQQPQAANLHAALGQLYLEQGQWGEAQAAYFEAHHYAPNQADYAYNLAICLDQMGKGALALPYYKKALLLAKTNPNNIDANALETRIQALEAN